MLGACYTTFAMWVPYRDRRMEWDERSSESQWAQVAQSPVKSFLFQTWCIVLFVMIFQRGRSFVRRFRSLVLVNVLAIFVLCPFDLVLHVLFDAYDGPIKFYFWRVVLLALMVVNGLVVGRRLVRQRVTRWYLESKRLEQELLRHEVSDDRPETWAELERSAAKQDEWGTDDDDLLGAVSPSVPCASAAANGGRAESETGGQKPANGADTVALEASDMAEIEAKIAHEARVFAFCLMTPVLIVCKYLRRAVARDCVSVHVALEARASLASRRRHVLLVTSTFWVAVA